MSFRHLFKNAFRLKYSTHLIVLWGNGSATREFLYVTDAAKGIAAAAEYYNQSVPVNLGTGLETTIAALAELIAEITGYAGKIIWDYTRPNGQPRRLLDTTKALKLFNLKAETSLREGLENTVNWYKKSIGY